MKNTMGISKVLLVIIILLGTLTAGYSFPADPDPLRAAVEQYFTDCRAGCNNLITSKQLKKMISKNQNPYLLDIRKRKHFNKQHIDGSVNIYWYDLGKHLEELPLKKKIVVICYTGQSSGQVTALLKILGYDACSLLGGIDNGWMEESFPLEAECGT